jgi:hypothetical protein
MPSTTTDHGQPQIATRVDPTAQQRSVKTLRAIETSKEEQACLESKRFRKRLLGQ